MSFRRRLTYALFLFGAVFLIVPILVFYYQVEASMYQTLDDALRSVARAELASAIDSPDDEPHIHDSSSSLLISLDSGSRELAWILNQKGEVVAKTDDLEEREILQVRKQLPQPGSEGVFVTVEMQGRSYRLLVATLTHQGEDYLEVFGLSREPLLRRLDSLKKQASSMFLVALLVLVMAAHRLSVSLTEPLTNLVLELEALDPTSEAGLSLQNQPQDRELRVLYDSVNSVLERLDYMLESQKHFVSDTSHEIRAPLTNLRLALEVCLRRERSSEEYREVLGVCEQEVSRLIHLAERLLTLSRLDSNELAFSAKETDLVRLVNDARELVSERLELRRLNLRFESPSKLVVQCDPGAVRQIVDNLLENSLRYAPEGSTVSISLEARDREARFQIENGGSRLTPEQCGRVFERFFRGDPSRQRETGGAGLGLSIVKGLVKAHQGRVGVEPLQGDRIRFWFTLPRG